ncbi:MAG: MFS transporter [Parvularcula sp.]
MKSANSSAVWFILATLTINALGFSIIIPVLPALLMDLVHTDAAGAAVWGGIASSVFAVMQFLSSPVLGGISDRFGRRPVLLMSLTALCADFLLMGLAHALWVFFIARTVSGIFAATQTTATAFITDVTSEDERTKKLGLIGAAFGVGFVFGPVAGGLLSEISDRAPFFAAAGLAGLNALYGYFAVPESLAAENRRAFDWARANAIGTLKQLAAAAGVGRLAAVYFLTSLSTFVYPAVWSYFAITKFGWSGAMIGWSLAYYGVCFVLSQAVVIPLVLPRLGERRAIWMGLLVEGIALLGVATAPSNLILFLWISTAIFSGIQTPALQKLMTTRVEADQQGELQGGLGALSSIVLLIAPLLYTQLLFHFERGVAGVHFPGAPFAVAAAINLLAFWVFLSSKKTPPDNA